MPMAAFALITWLRHPYKGNRSEVQVNTISRIGGDLDKELGDKLAELNIIAEQMQTAIAENSRMALDQNEYERRYANLTERYNTIKSEYDKISEQIESKKAQRELFKGFIRALEKQGALVEEFDEGLWSSLVQEVVVNAKDDIRFIFKNGFKIKRDKLNPDLIHIIIEEKIQKFDYKRSDSSVTIGRDGFDLLYY